MKKFIANAVIVLLVGGLGLTYLFAIGKITFSQMAAWSSNQSECAAAVEGG